jgi:hypothetical protein
MPELLTVSAFPIRDWQWGGTYAEVWLYANILWTDAMGVVHPGGKSGKPYQKIGIDIVGSNAMVRSFQTAPTINTLEWPVITACVVNTHNSRLTLLWKDYSFPTAPNPITKLELDAYNRGRRARLADRYVPRDELMVLLDGLGGGGSGGALESGDGLLVAGAGATIFTPSVDAHSPISAIGADDGITGRLYPFNRVAGVSFDIASENGGDEGQFRWFLF